MISACALFVLLCQLLSLQGEAIMNRVICAGSQIKTVACGYSQIIDIQSITIAYVANTNQCTEEYMIPIIESIQPPCKRSTKTNMNTDGFEVYKRCHGENNCVLGESVIDQEHVCGNTRPPYVSNVLRFNYSCVAIGTWLPHVALLPLNTDARGSYLELFSPYYPCNTPEGPYTLQCRVTPQRDNSRRIDYLVTRKLIELPQGGDECGDYLYFQADDTQVGPYHCNKRDRESWNSYVLNIRSENGIEIIYKVNRRSGVGGKFWIQIRAMDSESPIEVTMKCEGQDNIPQRLSAPCTPLQFFTSPATVTSTPPNKTPSATNLPQSSPPPSSTNLPQASTSPAPAVKSEQQINEGIEREGTNSSLLLAVLGSIIGLIIIAACVALIIFCKLRYRNKEVVEQNEVDAETPSTDLRPAAMKYKGKTLDIDEERSVETKETRTLQNDYPQQNMVRYGKTKRKAPNPGEGMTMERKQMATKPARPDRPPRPNSIMRMAALIKGKRKAPNPPSKPPKEVKHEKVAIVKPFDPLAETKESKKRENNIADTGACGASFENQPNKEATSEIISEADENVDDKSKSSTNDTADELNDITLDNGVENSEYSDNDNEVNEPVKPNLYENVKSKQGTDDSYTEVVIDESRQSIMLPDNYPNLSRTRTSVV